jgi:hypothetical protein
LDVGDDAHALLVGIAVFIVEPGVTRHDRYGHDADRVEEVGQVPVVALAGGFADQVGTHAARAEQHGALQHVLVLAGVGDRAPAQVLVGDRADLLRMAVPASLTDVEIVPQLQCLGERGVGHAVREVLREAVGEALSQLDELGDDALAGQLVERGFGHVLVDGDGQYAHDHKGDAEEAEPGNDEYA